MATDMQANQGAPRTPRVLLTGASGLLGAATRQALLAEGCAVHTLVRRAPAVPTEHTWNPATGLLDANSLEGFDAVIHLAGENIAARRWSPEQKRRIRDSRVLGTRLLAERLAERRPKSAVLICASATGYYGSRGDEVLTESAAAGTGFLAEVCHEWEAATAPAEAAGIRVVRLRLGLVLARQGGALAAMLPLFKLGLGGRLGNGRQWWSWLALTDAVRIIQFAIHQPALSGPVNAVAPEPVTNREFTQTLASVLRRPAFLPAPAFLLRLAVGEAAEALLLASARVQPAALTANGFRFAQPTLREALESALRAGEVRPTAPAPRAR